MIRVPTWAGSVCARQILGIPNGKRFHGIGDEVGDGLNHRLRGQQCVAPLLRLLKTSSGHPRSALVHRARLR